jgi:transcriptional regulator with XRE-family HTH domain
MNQCSPVGREIVNDTVQRAWFEWCFKLHDDSGGVPSTVSADPRREDLREIFYQRVDVVRSFLSFFGDPSPMPAVGENGPIEYLRSRIDAFLISIPDRTERIVARLILEGDFVRDFLAGGNSTAPLPVSAERVSVQIASNSGVPAALRPRSTPPATIPLAPPAPAVSPEQIRTHLKAAFVSCGLSIPELGVRMKYKCAPSAYTAMKNLFRITKNPRIGFLARFAAAMGTNDLNAVILQGKAPQKAPEVEPLGEPVIRDRIAQLIGEAEYTGPLGIMTVQERLRETGKCLSDLLASETAVPSAVVNQKGSSLQTNPLTVTLPELRARIKAALNACGTSQTDIGMRMGHHPTRKHARSRIADIHSRIENPSLTTICQLAAALGYYDPFDLISGVPVTPGAAPQNPLSEGDLRAQVKNVLGSAPIYLGIFSLQPLAIKRGRGLRDLIPLPAINGRIPPVDDGKGWQNPQVRRTPLPGLASTDVLNARDAFITALIRTGKIDFTAVCALQVVWVDEASESDNVSVTNLGGNGVRVTVSDRAAKSYLAALGAAFEPRQIYEIRELPLFLSADGGSLLDADPGNVADQPARDDVVQSVSERHRNTLITALCREGGRTFAQIRLMTVDELRNTTLEAPLSRTARDAYIIFRSSLQTVPEQFQARAFVHSTGALLTADEES